LRIALYKNSAYFALHEVFADSKLQRPAARRAGSGANSLASVLIAGMRSIGYERFQTTRRQGRETPFDDLIPSTA